MLFNYSKTYQDSILQHEGFVLDDYRRNLHDSTSAWVKRKNIFKIINILIDNNKNF